jgi:hypothetical protein
VEKKKAAKAAFSKHHCHIVVVVPVGHPPLNGVVRGSGATAAGAAAPAPAPAAHLGEVVENEAGIPVTAVYEVDLYAAQKGECPVIDDDLEATIIKHAVVGVDAIGEGHAEADTAAPAGARKDTHALDVVVDLGEQLTHLGLGGDG